MAGDADMAEQGENMLADPVVDHALAVDRALFLGVECGRIVLEILNDGAGLRAFIKNFGLAFINLATTGHCWFPLREESDKKSCPDCSNHG